MDDSSMTFNSSSNQTTQAVRKCK